MIESKNKNMVFSKEELDEMLIVAKPLMRWLSEHADPYSTVMVNLASAEMVQAYGLRKTEEFVKD